jgi:alpha-L-rhamnosidase
MTAAAPAPRIFLPYTAVDHAPERDPAIWPHAGAPAALEVAHFRTELTLARPIVGVHWVLFADTRYQAWLDGVSVGRGPVRFSHARRWFDVWPLGELAAGRHVLAVEVAWAPDTRRSESVRPLFMGHIEGVEGGRRVMKAPSGRAWLARLESAWQRFPAQVHPAALIGPTELVDLRQTTADWMLPGTRAGSWHDAVVVPDPGAGAAWAERTIAAQSETRVAVASVQTGWLSPGRRLVTVERGDSGTAAGGQAFQLARTAAVTVEALAAEIVPGGRPVPPVGITVDGRPLAFAPAPPARPDVYVAQVDLPAGEHVAAARVEDWGGAVLALGGSGLTLSPATPRQGAHAGRRLLLSELVAAEAAGAVITATNCSLSLTLGPGPAYAVLDLGRVVHGRLTADGSGPAGAVLDIGWDERLWQGRPWPHPGSRYPGWNQVDSWVLAGSARPVTTLDTRTGRYVLIASWAEGAVQLDNLRLERVGYPARQRGRFHSDSPRLDRIWQVGADTLATNMLDTYADPWRERGQWWGDAWVDAHINQAAFGDDALFRRGLGLMADAFDAGRPSALAPGDGPELLDFGMLWVQGLTEQQRLTGDTAFTRTLYDRVAPFLDHLTTFESPASGLLDLSDGPEGRTALIDWGSFKDWGTYYSRYGQSTAVNALYDGTLRDAAELADTMGDQDRARSWRTRAERVRDSLNSRNFDRATRRYITTRLPDRVVPPWPHAQAWPLAYGSVPEADVPAVAAQLVDLLDPDPGAPNVDIYGTFWLLEALARADRVADGLAVISRTYGRLLDAGATSWWESFYADGRPDQALSHGWGGAPTWFLTTHVLGARRTGPTTWQLRPALAGVSFAEGSLPLPRGDLVVSWRQVACGQHAVALTAPAGTTGQLVIPVRDPQLDVVVDGQLVWTAGQPVAGAADVTLTDAGIAVGLTPGDHAADVMWPCR